MSSSFIGSITEVRATRAGSNLASAAQSGATTLTVDDATPFAPSGARLQVGEYVMDYTSADPETGVVTLAAGLPVSLLLGEEILVHPAREERVAVVEVLPGRPGVDAVVPAALRAQLRLGERPADVRETVTVDRVAGVWTVADVHLDRARMDVDELEVVNVESAATSSGDTLGAVLGGIAVDFSDIGQRVEAARTQLPRWETTAPTAETPGESAGQRWYQIDPATNQIVAMWSWDAGTSTWVSSPWGSSAIGALDVGKLTASDANVNTLVAQKLAAATGEFVHVRAENIEAGTVTAALKLVSPEIEGGLITGTQIQTQAEAARGIKLGPAGLFVYDDTGAPVFNIDRDRFWQLEATNAFTVREDTDLTQASIHAEDGFAGISVQHKEGQVFVQVDAWPDFAVISYKDPKAPFSAAKIRFDNGGDITITSNTNTLRVPSQRLAAGATTSPASKPLRALLIDDAGTLCTPAAALANATDIQLRAGYGLLTGWGATVRRTADGTVHACLGISGPFPATGSAVVGDVPAGFRPPTKWVIPVTQFSGPVGVAIINTDGTVTLDAAFAKGATGSNNMILAAGSWPAA